MPKFNATKEELEKIRKIVARVIDNDQASAASALHLAMSVEACHCNDVKLDLDAMLAGELHQVSHDVFGINRYISVATGKLGNCFFPRYAKQP